MGEDSTGKTWRSIERHLNVPLLPILAALFGLLYLITAYRGWLVFFVGTAGTWLLAWIWVWSLARGLVIERQIHLAWAMVGDALHERLKVVNHSRFPALWLEIVDETTTLTSPLRLVSDVGGRAVRNRHTSHVCHQRGLYTLGPTLMRTGDPFGIYSLTIHDQHASTILVTPPLLALSNLRIKPAGWAGDQQRRRGVLERQISDAGLRDYQPGDSLRRIHWPASARSDSLIVRQLEAAASGEWWIFVDLESRVQAGNGPDSTLELAIVLAASLAVRGLNERRKVGLALAGPHLEWLEPRSGPAQRWRILRALSVAQEGDRSLASLLSVGRPSQTATLIVITPSSNPAWVAAAGKRRSRGGLTALLVNPTAFGAFYDQSRVIAALAARGMAHRLIPRSLLEEAYPELGPGSGRRSVQAERGKRYLQQGRAVWQSMD
jgi:uncharacterized protein (DUF58 family)